MAERVKDNKKRGSRLGPRKASVVEDGQDGSKEVTKQRKTPTFGRSFSKAGKSASVASLSFVAPSKDAAPERASLPSTMMFGASSSPALTDRAPGVQPEERVILQQAGRFRERSSSLGGADLNRASSSPTNSPTLGSPIKTRPGMSPMAAAFDALISSEGEEAQLPSTVASAAEALSPRKQTLSKEELLAENARLRDALVAMERRALAAEEKLAGGTNTSSGSGGSKMQKRVPATAPPPAPIKLPGQSERPQNDSVLSPAGNQSGAKSPKESVDAEVDRMRKEIKNKAALSIAMPPHRLSSSSSAILDSGGELRGRSGRDAMEDVAVEKFESMWMSERNQYSFDEWRLLAVMPGRPLVANVDGYNVESGCGTIESMLPAGSHGLVEPHRNRSFYANYLANIKHTNLVGITGIGAFADIPVIVSCEQVNVSRLAKLRRKPVLAMVRAPSGIEQLCFIGLDQPVAKLPYASSTCVDFLQQRFPGGKFFEVKSGEQSTACKKQLLLFEAMNIVSTYKFGVLRWVAGQTENEAFANHASPSFTSFLNWLATRVELHGWTKFRGGLNVRDVDVTGTHSYYTTLAAETEGGSSAINEFEIMFHVSSELPFSEADAQCLERKRHLGNDIVVVIFWEGEGEFDPSLIKSQFNHVFIVISVDGSSIPELDKIRYRITVAAKDTVPRWKPYLPYPPVFDRDDALRDWLLYKLVNGERSAMHAHVFRSKFLKTNTSFLRRVVDEYCDPASQFI